MAHNYVTSLQIVDSDGVDKGVTIGSNVVLEAGTNTALEVTSDNEIELQASSSLGQSDPTVLEKFTNIINGGGGFSGVPYYLSTIAGSRSDDGAFFLNVDRCGHFGQFDVNDINPESTDNLLSVLDVCPACDDCPEYAELYGYIQTVQGFIDGSKDDILDAVDESSSEGAMLGILNGYAAMIERWNYLVHLKSWRFNAEATGAEIHASCKYTNHTPDPIPAGVVMSIDFINVPDPTRAYIIDTAVLGTIDRTDLDLESGAGGSNSEDDASVTLTTTAAMAPGDGIRFYAGALSPNYVGDSTRVEVNFSLTMPSITDGIGDHDNSFTTNNMVVVEDWIN